LLSRPYWFEGSLAHPKCKNFIERGVERNRATQSLKGMNPFQDQVTVQAKPQLEFQPDVQFNPQVKSQFATKPDEKIP